MSQQRAPRFRAAQQHEELLLTRMKLERYYHSKGWDVRYTITTHIFVQ